MCTFIDHWIIKLIIYSSKKVIIFDIMTDFMQNRCSHGEQKGYYKNLVYRKKKLGWLWILSRLQAYILIINQSHACIYATIYL